MKNVALYLLYFFFIHFVPLEMFEDAKDVMRRRTDNSMVKIQRTSNDLQNTAQKHNTEQPKPHQKLRVNSGTQEG